MQVNIDISDIKELREALAKAPGQVNFALSKALNKTAEQAKSEIQTQMKRLFDRPTPFAINSLRIKYATKAKPTVEIAFKDINSALSAKTMIEPHVDGGKRVFKGMEARLRGIGILPTGWFAVPGAGANLDVFGNMSKGQISQMLNVLGTYTEGGYNKANDKTRSRLAKGNAKKNVYGFVYWVNPVSSKRVRHLLPGVYQRVKTGFGSSLKPILIFVSKVSYRQRLDFYGITGRVVSRDLSGNFSEAFEVVLKTSLLKTQETLL